MLSITITLYPALKAWWFSGKLVLLVTTTSGAVLKLFQVLYWFIEVDVRKPQTPPYTSIQKYKPQPKHDIETSPRWGKERLHYVVC